MKKIDYSLDYIKSLFDSFYKEKGHYPTTLEINSSFPISVKSLQRKFGGLIKLRKLLNLKVTDFTKGEERVKKATNSNNLSFIEQNRIYNKLLLIFKEYYIHRESPFGDNGRQRSDFKIYHKDGSFFIDIFYASTYEAMVGCINAKIKKFNPDIVWENVILINTNKDFDKNIEYLISNKKNPLPQNIKIMSEDQFFSYCNTLIPIV